MGQLFVECLEPRELLAALPNFTGRWVGQGIVEGSKGDLIVMIKRQTGNRLIGTFTDCDIPTPLKLTGTIRPDGSFTTSFAGKLQGVKVSGAANGRLKGTSSASGTLVLKAKDETGVGTFNLTLDDPDDRLQTATLRWPYPFLIRNKSIDSGSDVDLYAFTSTRNTRYSFRVSGSATLSPAIRLFNSKGIQVAAAVAKRASPHETSFTYTFRGSETYYLGVSSSANYRYNPVRGTGDAFGSVGSYSVTTTAYDPDDRFSLAYPLGQITTATSTTGDLAIPPAIDINIYSFAVSAGQHLGIQTASLVVDTYLRLFDSAGVQLAANDNDPIRSPYNGSYLDYTFASAGTYYLGVSDARQQLLYDPVRGSGAVCNWVFQESYGLIITPNPGSDDPDDQITEVTPIPLLDQGRTVAGQLSNVIDVNLVAFRAEAGQHVQFYPGPGGVFKAYLRLFDSTGLCVAYNPTSFTFASSGLYYLGVSSPTNISYDPISGRGDLSTSQMSGAYEVTIVPSDPDSSLLNASPIGDVSQPQTIAGQIDTPRDVDIYSFTVPPQP